MQGERLPSGRLQMPMQGEGALRQRPAMNFASFIMFESTSTKVRALTSKYFTADPLPGDARWIK